MLLAIPTSLLVALIVDAALGLTLNGMTLIGLTTAIGVLVDDSIVVLENIFTHLEQGKEPKQAAVDGRSEIGMAAIAITLVDVAVWGRSSSSGHRRGVPAQLRDRDGGGDAGLAAGQLHPDPADRLALAESRATAAKPAARRIAPFWEPAYLAFERLYARAAALVAAPPPAILLAALLVFCSTS